LDRTERLKVLAGQLDDAGGSHGEMVRIVAEAKCIVSTFINELPRGRANLPQLMHMVVFDGMKVSAAARLLGVNPQTAYSALSRGYRTLSAAMGIDVAAELNRKFPRRRPLNLPAPDEPENAFELYSGPSFQEVVSARQPQARKAIFDVENTYRRERAEVLRLWDAVIESQQLTELADDDEEESDDGKLRAPARIPPTVEMADAMSTPGVSVVKGSRRELSSTPYDARPQDDEFRRVNVSGSRQRAEGGTAYLFDPESTQNRLALERAAEAKQYGCTLNVPELETLTRRQRISAQRRALEAMQIPYRVRYDQTLAVLCRDVATFRAVVV
jgi:Domain of unknown function (DUF4224)